jgi:hypothetical protein
VKWEWSFDLQLFHFRRQPALRYTEALGGFRSGGGGRDCIGDLETLDQSAGSVDSLAEGPRQIDRASQSLSRWLRGTYAQIAKLNEIAVAEDRRTFDAVLQLADIARPVVRAKKLAGGLGDIKPGTAKLAREALQKEIDQCVDVSTTGTQRRDRDRKDIHPEEEIVSEGAISDRLLEIAVRRTDDTDIDFDRRRPADPLEIPFLQDAKDLGLDPVLQLSDLVEEHGASIGELESTDLPRARAGEGSLLVPEELVLDQSRGNRRAVDGNERARTAC